MSVSPEVQPLAGARASQPLIVIVHGLKGSHLRNKGCCCGLNLCCSRIYVNFWRLVSGALCGCGDQMKLPRRYDADGVQERGVLACVDTCQNYLLRSMAVAFPPFRPDIFVDLGGLGEKLKGFSVEFDEDQS